MTWIYRALWDDKIAFNYLESNKHEKCIVIDNILLP